MSNFRLIGAAVKPAIRHEQTDRHIIGNSYRKNIVHFELAIVPFQLLIDQERNHTGESLLSNKFMQSFM